MIIYVGFVVNTYIVLAMFSWQIIQLLIHLLRFSPFASPHNRYTIQSELKQKALAYLIKKLCSPTSKYLFKRDKTSL